MTCRYPAPDPGLETRGGAACHPVAEKRGSPVSKNNFFLPSGPQFGLRIRGAGAPLPWIRNCYPDLGSASDLSCLYENLLQPIMITTQVWAVTCLNPLSANSDQDQFSPNNTHALSTDKLLELIK